MMIDCWQNMHLFQKALQKTGVWIPLGIFKRQIFGTYRNLGMLCNIRIRTLHHQKGILNFNENANLTDCYVN